jgi:acetolactate synthase-1/2/3 large subunit
MEPRQDALSQTPDPEATDAGSNASSEAADSVEPTETESASVDAQVTTDAEPDGASAMTLPARSMAEPPSQADAPPLLLEEPAHAEPAAEPGPEATDAGSDASLEPATEPVAGDVPPAPAPVEPGLEAVESEPAPDASGAGPTLESTPVSDGEPEPEPIATGDAEPESRPRPEPTNVAELIAATLRAAGVRLAFTVPGESFLPVLDAMVEVGIRVVATRHESAAAFAAEAYGQLTGRPAACLGSRSVGVANMAIGIHTATADSTPMFVLAGQVDRSMLGRESFQEVDLADTIGRLAKWAGNLDSAATAVATLEAAVRAAVEGRPGPAFLAVPEDVLLEALPEGTTAPTVRPRPETPAVEDVREVLHFLASAQRPLIIAGAGVLRARCSNDLVRYAELLHVPVVASWRRGDVVPNDNPLYLGMTGFGSPSTVRERIAAADALVVIGSRLNEVTTDGYRLPTPGQSWIHVDIEPHDGPVGDIPAPIRAIRADARAFLRASVGRLKGAVLLAEPVAARDERNAEDRAAWEAASVVDHGTWDGPGVHPGRVITELRRLLPEDAIVTTDAGSFSGWAARGFPLLRPGTFLGPTSGAMGYGFPAALAAALVHRERRVVALVGDGGMAMSMAELETAVREEAHVVAIVFDNEQFGMIHTAQAQLGSPEAPGTSLGALDFAAVARACGARGVKVESDSAFESVLRTALAASGPSVIQLALDRRWVSVDQPAVS